MLSEMPLLSLWGAVERRIAGEDEEFANDCTGDLRDPIWHFKKQEGYIYDWIRIKKKLFLKANATNDLCKFI